MPTEKVKFSNTKVTQLINQQGKWQGTGCRKQEKGSQQRGLQCVCLCACTRVCVCVHAYVYWEMATGMVSGDITVGLLKILPSTGLIYLQQGHFLEVFWPYSHMHAAGLPRMYAWRFLLWLHYEGASFLRTAFIKVSQCASCLWPCCQSPFKQTMHSCNAERVAWSTWIKLNIIR